MDKLKKMELTIWTIDEVLDISMGAKIALLALIVCFPRRGKCRISQADLAELCCCKRVSIGKYVKELEEKGYISREIRPKRRTSYTINHD